MSDDNLVGLLVPIVIVLVVIGRRLFVASGSSRSGQPSYGIAGAAVCRKCGRAFSRPVWAPNMLVGKLLRCPHCGAWAILPAASAVEIEVAEARDGKPEPEAAATLSAEEALRKRIDASQYEKPGE